jgi:hypothetical protein
MQLPSEVQKGPEQTQGSSLTFLGISKVIFKHQEDLTLTTDRRQRGAEVSSTEVKKKEHSALILSG